MQLQRWALAIGATFGALGVVIGAFGAHALAPQLSEPANAIYQTAVKYLFIHALVLVFMGALTNPSSALNWSVTSFVFGILLFSGSLIAMALGAPKFLGVVTPVGGVLMIIGWLCLAYYGVVRDKVVYETGI